MTQKPYVSTALPTPEIDELLSRHTLPEGAIAGWFDYPSLVPILGRISKEQFKKNITDFEKILAPFFGLKSFFGSLNKMDFSVGCSKGCHTCLAKAPPPARMFSTESLIRGFRNPQILQMLDPYHLRIGNTAEPTDQSDFLEVIKFILIQTEFLDEQAKKQEKRHRVNVYTNYRPNSEEILESLIELARDNDRFELNISLPVNKTDSVNESFALFAAAHEDTFFYNELQAYMGYQTKIKNLYVFNVREGNSIFPIGRRLSPEILESKKKLGGVLPINRVEDYELRGMVDLLVNPDALWMMVYSTAHHSSTLRSYTPLNLENTQVLTLLPWIKFYFFDTFPPNWPGGQGERRDGELAQQMKVSDCNPFQKVDIVY